MNDHAVFNDLCPNDGAPLRLTIRPCEHAEHTFPLLGVCDVCGGKWVVTALVPYHIAPREFREVYTPEWRN